jgi:hypothetical protein
VTENRQPDPDMFLAAADAVRFRQVLAACSILMTWAESRFGPQFAAVAQDAAGAAGRSRAPSALAGDISLATGTTGFSSPARRIR